MNARKALRQGIERWNGHCERHSLTLECRHEVDSRSAKAWVIFGCDITETTALSSVAILSQEFQLMILFVLNFQSLQQTIQCFLLLISSWYTASESQTDTNSTCRSVYVARMTLSQLNLMYTCRLVLSYLKLFHYWSVRLGEIGTAVDYCSIMRYRKGITDFTVLSKANVNWQVDKISCSMCKG